MPSLRFFLLSFFFQEELKSRHLYIAAIKHNRPSQTLPVKQRTVVHFALKQQVFFFFMASLYLTWIRVCSSIFTLNHILQIGRQRCISLSGDPGKIQFYDGTISLSLSLSQIHFVVARLFGLLSRKAPGQSCAKTKTKKKGPRVLTCETCQPKQTTCVFWVTECR